MIGKQGYIKNMGSTQTFIKRPYEKERYNDIHWEADYDGDQANIRLNIDDNGNNAEVRANLNNDDLAQLLNIKPIRGDLVERLVPLLEQEQEPTIVLREPLHPRLKYQPFLRPQPLKTRRRSVKYNKLAKALKDASVEGLELVGKTAALKYRTPLPKTMRIHLTSDSRGGRKTGKKRSLRNKRNGSTRKRIR